MGPGRLLDDWLDCQRPCVLGIGLGARGSRAKWDCSKYLVINGDDQSSAQWNTNGLAKVDFVHGWQARLGSIGQPTTKSHD